MLRFIPEYPSKTTIEMSNETFAEMAIENIRWKKSGKLEFEACDCDYSHPRILNFIKLQSFKVGDSKFEF